MSARAARMRKPEPPCTPPSARRSARPGRPAGLDTELAEGTPERVLISRSATADLLVLGTQHSQNAAGLSVGPVIRTCLIRARCPVVVVSPGSDQESGRR